MKPLSVRRFVILLTMAAGAITAQTAPRTALPGTVNYIEGSVSIDGGAVNASQNGQVTLQRNQTLTTAQGKAEVLMSPGVFLRIGDNGEVRMISPELVNPQVEVVRGSAMLEVDSKVKDASITVLERGASASVLKAGLYRFDGDAGRIAVVDGDLNVTESGHTKKIGKGKEIVLDSDPRLKSVSFDSKAKDSLYVWSEVRSESLAEANASTAQYIYSGYGPYAGNGWYWNPGFSMYSWLPGDGFFYSPFGYPFYSIGYVPFYRAYYYGGYRGPYRGGQPVRTGFVPRVNSGASAPAVHGFTAAPRMSGGGGFRGGGGRR